MKRKVLICMAIVLVAFTGLILSSFLAARQSLRGEIVSRELKGAVPDPARYSALMLTVDPLRRSLCWCFLYDTEAGPIILNVSLFGKPQSLGQTIRIETEPQTEPY